MANDAVKILKENTKLLPFYLFFILLTWLVSGHIFFWDTVQLGAKQGLFFYENNFSKLLLPDIIDSGHIPAFGAYLALCWKIFGKSLFVSHFAMLPFLIGIVWQSFILIKNYIRKKYFYLALILFLADPTLLSQAALVSPDIPLVFLFLLALNSVLHHKSINLSIAAAGLILISMRGMMVAFAVLIIDILLNVKFEGFRSIIIQLLKKSIIYFPALIIFIVYNYYHYSVKGWIGYHETSPWAPAFQRVGPVGFLYNIGILIWRLIDFGRVFLWGFSFIVTFLYFKMLMSDRKVRQLLLIFFIILVSLSVSFLLYKNLSGHRYLLPAILLFAVYTNYLIFEKIKAERLKYILFIILLAGLLTGNLWIYPDKIAKGWDSTLAHLPYYHLRDEMMNYMQKNGIRIEDAGSVFPDAAELKYLDLSESTRKHAEKDLNTNEYIIYSNIFNDFEDNEIDRLKTDFTLVKDFHQSGVFIRLYKRKDLPKQR